MNQMTDAQIPAWLKWAGAALVEMFLLKTCVMQFVVTTSGEGLNNAMTAT
jgi:hypothetical protein